MYLIDTNVLSEARRGTREAVAWLRLIDPLTVHLSVVTIGEVARGIARLRLRNDPRSASRIQEWLDRLRHDFGDRILPITDDIAVVWGGIAARRPRGDAGGLIAATAIVHDLTVVTRNVDDFDDTGAATVDPWA